MSDIVLTFGFSSFGGGTRTAPWVGLTLTALFVFGIGSLVIHGLRQKRKHRDRGGGGGDVSRGRFGTRLAPDLFTQWTAR